MGKIEVVTRYEEIPDVEAVALLIQRQMEFIQASSDRMRILMALKYALAEAKRAVLFLWRDADHKPRGFAFCNICAGLETGADYLWINELFVDVQFRQRSVASSILNYIENWAKRNAIKYVACITGEENVPAQSLYRKNGFSLHATTWVDKQLE